MHHEEHLQTSLAITVWRSLFGDHLKRSLGILKIMTTSIAVRNLSKCYRIDHLNTHADTGRFVNRLSTAWVPS